MTGVKQRRLGTSPGDNRARGSLSLEIPSVPAAVVAGLMFVEGQ
jgi:hypothetical protein